MLIRINGAKAGIKEYLEKGHKQGRELSRDDLDERVILAGDLDFTDQLINDMQVDGDRYLHITLAFKEDELPRETLLSITREFEKFVFAAYGTNEYNYYAEAHLPKVKSYVNARTGEMVERKPHIHIVIPKVNILSGGFLNPVGMVEHNERFLDAFQEHINNKYGLASPKDNRRINFTDASDMIQRYKDDHFDGKNKDLKREILGAVLERNIVDYEAFKSLVAEYGHTRMTNEGQAGEYVTVKLDGESKGIRLKDLAFTREFIEKPEADKRFLLSAEIQRKYEVAGLARRDPANVQAGLDDWYSFRAMEVKYLNSGNKKQYESYRSASPVDRQRILAEQAMKFYAKYQEPQHEPERFKRNAFEHTYGYKQPERAMERGHDGPGGWRSEGRAARGERPVDGRGDGDRGGRGSGGGARAFTVDDGGRGATGADSLRGTAPDDLTRQRIAFDTSRQHHAFPIGGFQSTKTINGVPILSSINVAGHAARPKVLLPDHARIQLDDGTPGRVDPMRRDRYSERLSGTGRDNDSALSQLKRDFIQRKQVDLGGEVAEFKQIKLKLDANRLLTELSHSHGLIIDKYLVSQARDGSSRILCGKHNLNVSDFLTKEIRLSWADSSAILRDSYTRQIGRHPAIGPRQAPSRALWRQFQDERREHGGQRQLLTQQLASERARRDELRRTMEHARISAQALSPSNRKAAVSIARMSFMTADAALQKTFRAERAQFRSPVAQQYRNFLHGRAQGGDDQALAELRRMTREGSDRENFELGSISPAGAPQEPNALFYRGKEVRYLVHQNGDVVYSLAGRAIIQDRGDKLVMLQTDRLAVETALRLAHSKFGSVITLTGPKAFQEQAVRVAAEAGVPITFENKRIEQIRQQRASELASERAKKAEHRELGTKFVEGQRQSGPAAPESPGKLAPSGVDRAEPAPAPAKNEQPASQSKPDKGPER